VIVWREIRRQPATALWTVMVIAALVAAWWALALDGAAGPGTLPGQPAIAPAIVVQPASPVHGSQVPVPSRLPPR